jgi:hypothetical protein
MMDAVEAIGLSQAEFERRLREVRDDQWAWPTPCEQWTVRVDVALERLEPAAALLAQSGLFGQGSSGAVESTEPNQRRLLDICGRRP